jgi:integrase
MCAILRKHLAYLVSVGRENIFEISSRDFPQYIVSTGISGRYLSSTKYCVKKFYNYLKEKYGVSLTWQGILNKANVPEIRVHPYTMMEELDVILSQIDRTTSKGKRDYAAIFFGAHTDLRAIDIVNLKLMDVDWYRFELHIIQEKTKCPLALLITADVGEAIRDYILNRQPHSESEYVFLRTKASHKRIESVISFNTGF